jgi:hypothetical protein
MHEGVCTVREIDLDTSVRAFRTLPTGVAIWQLRNPRDVRSLRLVGVNPAAERELRAPLAFALGKPISESFPRLLDTPIPERYRGVILSGKPDTFGELVYGDARIPEGTFWVDCFPLPDGCVGVALENITDRKRVVENQSRALRLLHRVTLFLNDAPTVIEAAQFCVDQICTKFDFAVGRFFLADESCPSRFVPNPVWHFGDPKQFKAFRKATELYERDLTNKLALEYRTIQGQKAGLSRSLGFSVVENDFLRGVLEFSSEGTGVAVLDEHVFRAISNVGFQLGQVFARERAARRCGAALELVSPRDEQLKKKLKCLRSTKSSRTGTPELFQSLKRTHGTTAILSEQVVESTRRMHRRLDELKRAVVKPVESRSILDS